MKANELSVAQRKFNEESNFLNQMYEFHRKWFHQLDASDHTALSNYYLFDKKPPEDIMEHQKQMVAEQPEEVTKAHEAFKKFITIMGMDSFKY